MPFRHLNEGFRKAFAIFGHSIRMVHMERVAFTRPVWLLIKMTIKLWLRGNTNAVLVDYFKIRSSVLSEQTGGKPVCFSSESLLGSQILTNPISLVLLVLLTIADGHYDHQRLSDRPRRKGRQLICNDFYFVCLDQTFQDNTGNRFGFSP